MARTPRSEAEILASIPGARARAAEADAAEPRAASAAYNAREERVRVELKNGCAVLLPVHLVPGLEGASPEQLAGVSVEDGGAALRWEELDADVALPGLVARVLDVRAWAARYLGQATSEAKARAARENGKKGGRPRKHPAAPAERGGVLYTRTPRRSILAENPPGGEAEGGAPSAEEPGEPAPGES